MAHIHTGPGQHDLTASAFVVRLDTPEPTIMFHMHEKIEKLMFFGGHVELDENPWHALVREIREESGYDMSDLQILQPQLRIKKFTDAIAHPTPLHVLTTEYKEDANHYHTDICYAFVAKEPPQQQPDDGEVTDFQLLTLKDIQNLPTDKIFGNIRESATYLLSEVMHEWQKIPTSEVQAHI